MDGDETMGDPPPRQTDNKAAPAEAVRDNAWSRESTLLLPTAAGTLFHKRKSKRANNLESCKEAEMTKKKKKKKHNNNHTNRRMTVFPGTPCPGGGEEVVIAVKGGDGKKEKVALIEDAQDSDNNNISGDPGDTLPLRTGADRRHTIRKRIKFIMGGDDEPANNHKKEEAEAVDQRNRQLPRANVNGDEAKMRPNATLSPSDPLQTNSTLRLRTPCNIGAVPQQEDTVLGKKKFSDKKSAEPRSKTDRNKITTTRNASTSNRTRFRFFRLNKRTIRAVVLLLVKLCGLLVASILIPSSKLVTAVGPGVARSEPPQGSATNMDDLLDEYGDLMSVDGYASSTIIAVSPTNGNYFSCKFDAFVSQRVQGIIGKRGV